MMANFEVELMVAQMDDIVVERKVFVAVESLALPRDA